MLLLILALVLPLSFLLIFCILSTPPLKRKHLFIDFILFFQIDFCRKKCANTSGISINFQGVCMLNIRRAGLMCSVRYFLQFFNCEFIWL